MTDEEKRQKLELILEDNQQLSVAASENAIHLAESLQDSDFRSWYLSRLAQKLAISKQLDKALIIARSATGFYDKMDALLVIADEMVKNHEIQMAIDRLREVTTAVDEAKSNEIWPWQKAETLNRVARLFRQIGDIDSALDVWGKAIVIAQLGESHDIDSSSVLAEIAKELSLAGQLAFAKQVAESIQSPGKRENALKQIDLQNDG
jgi:tetratricopeptide (TPR) repeat protein